MARGWVAVLMVVLVVVAGACTGGAETQDVAAEGAASADAAGVAGADEPAAEGEAQMAPRATAGEDEAAAPASLPAQQISRSGERIIKDGTISLEVAEGSFDRAYAAVVAAASRAGGSVIASTTTSTDGGRTSGSVTVRVPVERYEALLVDVADIGKVRHRQITAEDVTAEYVDLESRQRHLEAQERFYLELLERAEDVQDAIAVQQQLANLQAELERVKGRLQFLAERTAFSTLTVELFEPGVPVITAERNPVRPTLAAAWSNARDAFITVVGAMLVVAFFLAPLAVPALLAWLVWRQVRSRPQPIP